MDNFTPGPWTYDRRRGVRGPTGERILVDGVSLPTGNHPDAKEAEANACLLAAAPDLLEALRAIASYEAAPGLLTREDLMTTITELQVMAHKALEAIDE